MTTPFRAAIVGCGRIAGLHDHPATARIETHARAYAAHPMTTLVGACDTDPDRRRRFGATWNVPVVDSVEALLEATEPAIVSVTSSSDRHFDHLMAILSRPAGPAVILAEKPVCTDPAQLAQLCDTARSATPAVMVNHTRRFDPAHREVADVVRRGGFGALIGGRADYYGGWVQNGTHLVDTLRMLLGDVSCTSTEPGVAGRADDDCPVVQLAVAGAGVTAFGFDEAHYQLFEIDLRFERARVLIEDFGADLRIQPVEINAIGERALTVARERRLAGLRDPLRHAVDAIVGHLVDGADLAATGATLADAAETMRIVWQARAVYR